MVGVELGLVQQKTIKQKEWSSGSGLIGPSRPAPARTLLAFHRIQCAVLQIADLGILTLYQWLLSDLLLSDIARSKPLDHSNCVTNA